MSAPQQVGRNSMVVNDRGDTGHLSTWLSELEPHSKSGLVGKGKNIWARMQNLAQVYDEQNKEVMSARFQNRQPRVPSIEGRRDALKRNLQVWNAAKAEADNLQAEIDAAHGRLRDDLLAVNDTKVNSFRNALYEIAILQHLRETPSEKRRDLLQAEPYKLAALRAPPQLSGMSPELHAATMNMEIQKRFPDQLQYLEHARTAHRIASLQIRTLGQALDNEGMALGPSHDRQPSRPWVPEAAAASA